MFVCIFIERLELIYEEFYNSLSCQCPQVNHQMKLSLSLQFKSNTNIFSQTNESRRQEFVVMLEALLVMKLHGNVLITNLFQ